MSDYSRNVSDNSDHYQDLDFSYQDCVPPFNLEAEEAILGGVLLDQEGVAFVRVKDEGLISRNFYSRDNAILFHSIEALKREDRPVDLMTIVSYLSDHDLLDTVGGQAKIFSLVSKTISNVNIDFYAKLVIEKSNKRDLIWLFRSGIEKAYGTLSFSEVLGFVRAKMDKLLKEGEKFGESVTTVGSVACDIFSDEIAPVMDAETLDDIPAPDYVPTPYFDLNNLLNGGFPKGELTVLAARTSVGKSQMAVDLVTGCCLNQKTSSLLFSLEMPRRQVVKRIMSRVATPDRVAPRGIPVSLLQDPRSLHGLDEDCQNIVQLVGGLEDLPIWINDQSALTLSDITRSLTIANSRMRDGQRVEMIVVDYIGLMSPGQSRYQTRTLEIGGILKGLLRIAREFDIVVVVISQINRESQKRKDKTPTLEDLSESDALATDSSVVMALHRDEEAVQRDTCGLELLKNRSGSVGSIKLGVNFKHSWFMNLYTQFS